MSSTGKTQTLVTAYCTRAFITRRGFFARFRKRSRLTTAADSRTITTLFGCRLRHRGTVVKHELRPAVIKTAIDNYPIINYSCQSYAIFDKKKRWRGKEKRGNEKENQLNLYFLSLLSGIHLTVIRYRCITLVLI